MLTESDAIIEYVDERIPDGRPLLPAGPEARARARMLSRLVDFRIEAAMRRLFPKVKEGLPLDAADLAPAEEGLALVARMADPAGPWGCGSEPGLADVGLATNMVWLDLLRTLDPDHSSEGREPARLAAWRNAWSTHGAIEPLLGPYRALARSWVDGAKR